MLVNLLANAVTYNRDGGAVDIRWTVVDDDVRIDVRDTGLGIVKADLERLFMPFDRLDADERGIPGTGLGLSLSRSLVQAMGGRLDVASTPGRGSTFSVTLHLDASTETATYDAAAELPSAPIRGRVVYIDDNAANLMLMRRGLARLQGVELLTATDATGGLTLVRRELPDLVLLDVQLPDGRGEGLLAEMQRNPAISAIPVVVLSSDPSPRVEAELRRAGVAEYLQKPLDLPAALALIDRILPGGEASTPPNHAAR